MGRVIKSGKIFTSKSEASSRIIVAQFSQLSFKNFFAITALCEANYCKSDKPFYRAAQFGSYFKETGWVEVNFPDAKSYLAQASDLDLVAQRGALHGGSMGHIAIPIQLNASRKIVVAQGNYHQSTHEIETWDDAFAQGFHYYVNFAPGANHVSR